MLYGAMNFPVRPVLQEFEDILKLGFDYVELTMDPPQSHWSSLRREKKAIVSLLNDNNMAVVCHLPSFLSIADMTESIRQASLQEIMDSLEIAAEFCPLKVVLHPPYVTGLGMLVFDQAKKYGLESLDSIVEKARSLGLTLCIENMFAKSHMLMEPEDFEEVFRRFPDLKFTLDTGHANIRSSGGRRLQEFVRRFSDRLHHIHVSDNLGREDNHLPVDTGTVDFRGFAKSLKGMGYDGTATFEIFSRDRTYLKLSRDMFASMMKG